MKFMVFNTPNGQNRVGTDPSTRIDPGPLKALLNNGTLEVAYSTVAGGHIYVVNADDTEDLVRIVRSDPFFHDSNTEVIPIMDAIDFLTGWKKATR